MGYFKILGMWDPKISISGKSKIELELWSSSFRKWCSRWLGQRVGHTRGINLQWVKHKIEECRWYVNTSSRTRFSPILQCKIIPIITESLDRYSTQYSFKRLYYVDDSRQIDLACMIFCLLLFLAQMIVIVPPTSVTYGFVIVCVSVRWKTNGRGLAPGDGMYE